MIKIRPRPFILMDTDHGMMIVPQNDKLVLADGEHGIGVGLQIMTNGVFEPEEIALVKMILEMRRAHHGDGVMALDLGANIGAHTVEWGKLMADWGRVLAVEAQEQIYYCLCGNIVLNGLLNTTALNAAVAAERGTMQIPVLNYAAPASYGSLELQQHPENEEIGQPVDYTHTRTIGTLPIDSLALPRCDFMKVDVEGMELDVLRGARHTLMAHRPIVLVEIIKRNGQQAVEYLQALDYDIRYHGLNAIAIHRADPCIQYFAAEEKKDE